MAFTTRVAAGVAAAVMIAGTLGAAPRAQALREGDLAAIKSLKCAFGTAMRVAWKDGVPQPARETATLAIEITEIEAADGSALIGSGATAEDINVQVYGWNMHFLEPSRAGRIAVTTVFAQYSTGTRLKAVHSRSEFPPTGSGEPQVVQYYGDCEATR